MALRACSLDYVSFWTSIINTKEKREGCCLLVMLFSSSEYTGKRNLHLFSAAKHLKITTALKPLHFRIFFFGVITSSRSNHVFPCRLHGWPGSAALVRRRNSQNVMAFSWIDLLRLLHTRAKKCARSSGKKYGEEDISPGWSLRANEDISSAHHVIIFVEEIAAHTSQYVEAYS